MSRRPLRQSRTAPAAASAHSTRVRTTRTCTTSTCPAVPLTRSTTFASVAACSPAFRQRWVPDEVCTRGVDEPERQHHRGDQGQPAGPDTSAQSESGNGDEHHERRQLMARADDRDEQEGHHEGAHPMPRPGLGGRPPSPPCRQVGAPEAAELGGPRGQRAEEQRDHDEVQEEAEGLGRQVVLVLPVAEAEDPEHEPAPSRIARQVARQHAQGSEPQTHVEHRRPQGNGHRVETGRPEHRRQEGEETRPVEVRVDVRVDPLGAREGVGDAEMTERDLTPRYVRHEGCGPEEHEHEHHDEPHHDRAARRARGIPPQRHDEGDVQKQDPRPRTGRAARRRAPGRCSRARPPWRRPPRQAPATRLPPVRTTRHGASSVPRCGWSHRACWSSRVLRDAPEDGDQPEADRRGPDGEHHQPRKGHGAGAPVGGPQR